MNEGKPTPMDSSHFEEILATVRRPARYVGGEQGQVCKPFDRARTRVCLVFPDLYEIGMSNYGLHILYFLLNAREDTACERAYAVAPDMEAALRTADLPLTSLETRTPLHEFDIVGFGLQSELTFVNVLQVLDLGGIPLRSSDRDDTHPLVIAGGHAAFNPEPLADFIDAFGLGDGEDLVGDIRDAWEASAGRPRRERLERLAQVPGVYVPALYAMEEVAGWLIPRGPRVVKRNVASLETAFVPDRQIIPWVETVHDRLGIEVMRGCTQGCRFCQAGMITRPVRERSAERVLDMARTLVDATGMDELSLLSLSTADHSSAVPMATRVRDEIGRPLRVNITLPSSRADAFNVALSAMVGGERKGGVTLAPEAGSDRLRGVINKVLTEDDILQAVRAAAQGGQKHVKLYFLVGLPTETDDDLRAMVELIRRCEAAGQEVAGRRFEVNVSVSGLVPKPHTPFQWQAQLTGAELERRYRLVREGVPRRLKVGWADSDQRFLEGLLTRGDRRAGTLLLEAYQRGARLDAWNEYRRPAAWHEALAALEWDTERSLGPRDLDQPLPWDPIDCGVSAPFLRSEWKKALHGRATRDCRGGCVGCLACDATGVEMQYGERTTAPLRDPVKRAWKRRQAREA